MISFTYPALQQRPFKSVLKGRPVRIRVTQDIVQPVWTRNASDPFVIDNDGLRPNDVDSSSSSSFLGRYMRLPAAQYACVPMPLNSYLNRIRGTPDRFLLGVPPVKFGLPKMDTVEVAPEVTAVVDVAETKVTITAESCRIVSRSEWVENLKLNERFELSARATLTWNATDEANADTNNDATDYYDGDNATDDENDVSEAAAKDSIRCESVIEIDVYPPGKFRLIPRRVMERVGNAAMNFIVGLLQEEFVKGLGKDYERWAMDEAYRTERKHLEEELLLELEQMK